MYNKQNYYFDKRWMAALRKHIAKADIRYKDECCENKISRARTFWKYVLIYHKQHIVASIIDNYKYTVPDVF